MRILVANDDGYQSLGIQTLHTAMSQLGDAIMVAPDRNCSGASNSLTLKRPVAIKQRGDDVYSVEGTPADCVHIALGGFLTEPVDIVVSGINDGPNMGDDVLYSGTVAAAMEGRFLGKSAIALSMATHNPEHFETAAKVAATLVENLAQGALPEGVVLNINVPDIEYSQIQGLRLTRLGTRHRSADAIMQQSHRGDLLYWVGPAGKIDDESDGTDFHAVANNCVSITPLTTDLTNVDALQPVSQWLERVE